MVGFSASTAGKLLAAGQRPLPARRRSWPRSHLSCLVGRHSGVLVRSSASACGSSCECEVVGGEGAEVWQGESCIFLHCVCSMWPTSLEGRSQQNFEASGEGPDSLSRGQRDSSGPIAPAGRRNTDIFASTPRDNIHKRLFIYICIKSTRINARMVLSREQAFSKQPSRRRSPKALILYRFVSAAGKPL